MEVLISQHIDIEGPGMIEAFLKRKGLEVKIRHLYKDEPLPSNPSLYDLIIILGGPMNVYEEERYPFLKEEDRFIKRAIDAGSPLLGICLGGQLIAKALGARVTQNYAKEIGWYRVRLTDEGKKDLLFKDIEREIEIFQWHEDTFEIPPNASHLIESSLCRNQGFRYGDNIYGLQFHLEVTEEMINKWIEIYDDEFKELDGSIDPVQIIEETKVKILDYQRNANIIFDNLLKTYIIPRGVQQISSPQ